MMADLISRRRLTSLFRVIVFPVAFGGSLWLAAGADAQTPIHKYNFNVNAGVGGTFNDLVGSAHGTLFNDATISGGSLILPNDDDPGGMDADHAKLLADGPNGVNIFNQTNATFAVWASIEDNDDWERLFDIGYQFGANAGNSIFVTPNAGGGGVGLRGAISNVMADQSGFANENIVETGTVPPNNQRFHVAFTFDGDNDIGRLYLNGGVVDVNDEMTHMLSLLDFPASPGPDRPNFALLGAALYNDNGLEGSISQFEIYNAALTEAQVLSLYAAGPDGEGATNQSRLIINRNTGTMSLTRLGAAATTVVGYSLTSDEGGLNPASWLSIANNYDENNGGEVDPDEVWTILSAAGSNTDFSEISFDDTGTGATFGATPIPLGGNGAWIQSIYEDVEGQLLLNDGTFEDVIIAYEGNNSSPFERSDLDFDGEINTDDWTIFLANVGQTFVDMTDAETYGFGDLNGDGATNVADFRLFKADYAEANEMEGAGASLQLSGSVPEPATLSLFAMALAGIGLLPRQRRRVSRPAQAAAPNAPSRRHLARCLAIIPAAFAILAVLPGEAQAVLRNQYSFSNAMGAAADGAIIEDLVGTADGTVRGAGAMFTGTTLTLPGGESATGNAYVDLPNGLISSIHTNASFEAWYTITSFQQWSRIFDFGSSGGMEVLTPINPPAGAGDTLFYGPSRDATINQQRFSIENDEAATLGGIPGVVSGGNITSDSNVATTLNSLQHVVATVIKDADGAGPNIAPRLTVFINGAQVDTDVGAEANAFQLENLNDVNNWLGKSNYGGDNLFHGALDEFRIYTNAFTPSDAGKNFLLGPTRTGEILKLVVNTISGQVEIQNEQGDLTLPLDYYKITSPDGLLNATGWSSFDEGEGGDPIGEGWDVGDSDANTLQEYFLDVAGDTFAAGDDVSLGMAFNPAIRGSGVDGDLVFEYGGPSGYLIQGAVFYEGVVPPGNPGDYNLDLVVNAADYTVYRNCRSGVGGCTALPAGTDDTVGVGQDDFVRWKTLYGTTYGGGASVDGGGDVPEPTTLVSLLCGLVVAGVSFGRGRRSVVR